MAGCQLYFLMSILATFNYKRHLNLISQYTLVTTACFVRFVSTFTPVYSDIPGTSHTTNRLVIKTSNLRPSFFEVTAHYLTVTARSVISDQLARVLIPITAHSNPVPRTAALSTFETGLICLPLRPSLPRPITLIVCSVVLLSILFYRYT